MFFDEVKTGFRVANGGAQEYFDIQADLVTYAKAMGNGFPIAAIAGKEEVMMTIEPGSLAHGGTYSGNVVGGIVGVKKYIYDVFGDTINTASRMESNSMPKRVNISAETFMLLKDTTYIKANNITFEKRTPIQVKGKGLMEMYFINTQPV